MLDQDQNNQETNILISGKQRLSKIISKKKNKVIQADHKSYVSFAVDFMCKNKVGSIVVINNTKPIGIFTERDLMERVVYNQLDPALTQLRLVMTSPFSIGSPEMTIDEAASLMTDKRIRHLPVYERRTLAGRHVRSKARADEIQRATPTRCGPEDRTTHRWSVDVAVQVSEVRRVRDRSQRPVSKCRSVH